MEDKKKLISFIVIGVIVVIGAIFLAGTVFYGGGDDGGSSSKTNTKPSKDLEKTIIMDSVLRSTDSGELFETYFTIATSTKPGVADVLSIVFHPLARDRVFVTTDKDGIFLNENKVNRWIVIDFPPKKIYSFILDKSIPDNRMFASGVVADNGRLFRTDNGGAEWRAVYAEPGQNTNVSAIVQHPKSPNLILAGTSNGTIIKSLDSGNTWKNVGQKIDGRISNFSFDSKRDPFAYMLSYQRNVYYSTDNGSTWKNWEEEKAKEVAALNAKAMELTRAKNIAGAEQARKQASALNTRNGQNRQPGGIVNIVADPTISGVIYAGTSNGLYRSKDFGKYWDKLNIIESAERFQIKSIAINPKNSNEIVFVAGKSFYKSVNGGDTWSVLPINNNRNASFVAYDPYDPKIIFIGLSSQ